MQNRQTKEFSVALDMKRTLAFPPFEVVEGDTGNVLHVALTNDGEAVDLSGCGVCIVFASSAGFAIQDLTSGIALGEQPGTFSVSLYPDSYGAGDVRADVQVYSGEEDEVLITSKRFTFRCIKGLMQPDIIRANSAYPPLIEAQREARAAAEAALAAAERIDTDIGELNVQPDWSEEDAGSDAYIRNRPATFPASAHAASHAAGGADALTPADIGAWPENALHAPRHASSGADALAPADIGAEAVRLQFTGISVPAGAFVDYTAEAGSEEAALFAMGYEKRASVALTGVLASMTPSVTFSLPSVDAAGIGIANQFACYTGGIYVYADGVPESAITALTIECRKAVA